MKIVHLICSILLILAHGVFLGRGLYFLQKKSKPVLIDKLARNLAQALIPLTIFSGLFFRSFRQVSMLWHILPALLIIILIPLNFILRKFILKTRRWPWLLPVAIFLLILCAILTGFAA